MNVNGYVSIINKWLYELIICLVHFSRQNYNLFRFSRPLDARPIHTSSSRWGLEEFFDLPENWGETTVKSGTTELQPDLYY